MSYKPSIKGGSRKIDEIKNFSYINVYKYCVMYSLGVYSINTSFFMNILIAARHLFLIHEYKYE